MVAIYCAKRGALMLELIKVDGAQVIRGTVGDAFTYRAKADGDTVKFKRAGAYIFAKVPEGAEVKIYKKPHAQTFHKELLKQNGLALHRGLSGVDGDALLDNMLDCVGILR